MDDTRMLDAASLFPLHSLRARPPIQLRGCIGSALAILLFANMLAFGLFWVAPELFTDWQVRDVAVRIRDAHLTDGSCSGQLFFHMCDVTLTAPGGIERPVHYAFAAFTLGDFTATPVADPRRPEWITTDLGLDHFWNRVACLLAAAALLAGFILAGARGIFPSSRNLAAWRRGSLTPVAVQFVSRTLARNGTALWTVRSSNGRESRWTMPGRAKPFVLGPGDRVLGLAFANGGGVMPLDARLRWVKLSAEARRAALARQAAI